jgi:hypothetical protein
VGSFLGTRKDMGRRAQGTDIILCGGPAGEFSRGFVYRALQRLWRWAPFSIGALLRIMGVRSPGTLRDSGKGALETGHLSLSELCYGNLEEGLVC